ncbi:AsmA-like C-terminal region-containing protein [Telmatospirillum siberiense]|uniref:YhdP family protein n=1 Tax=Telmatospirillum siberiense TaxID=382514 RepID=UPI0011AFCC31|nr:AsmA-like C-terminal region-containing protein [Telmatospirillum siberiense]
MHGTVRSLFQLLGAVGASVVVFVAWFGYRLSEAPLNLSLLTPYIEDALSAPDGGFAVKLEKTVLAWNKETRTIEIRAVNVRAISGEREVIAAVPELQVSLSGPSLMRGQIAPRWVRLRHPVIRLRRDAQGQIQFGMGDDEETGTKSSPAILEAFHVLLEPPGGSDPGGQLQRIEVVDGDLAVDDEILGVRWHAPRADLRFNRDQRGIAGHARIDLQLAGDQARFDADGFFNATDQAVDATLSFGGIRPSLLASLAPALQPIAGLHLPTGGTVALRYSIDQGLRDIRFDLVGGEGVIDASSQLGVSWPVQSVAFKGALVDGLNSLVLDELRVDMGGPLISLTGRVDDIGGASRVEAQAHVDDMPLDTLKGAWPPVVAPNPRTWILANLSRGRVRVASANLSAHRLAGQSFDDLSIDRLDGEVVPEGVTVQYLHPMPPIANVNAHATFNADTFTIDVKSGEVFGLKVPEGKVILGGLSAPDQFADISLKVTGPVEDALRLIDSKPLSWAQALGVQPTKVKGDAMTSLALKFPLLEKLTFDQMKVRAQAQTSHFGLPDVALGLDLSEGALSLDIDPKGMDVSGKALLGGMPADIRWRENFSRGSPFRSRYQVSAVLGDAERRLVGLDADPFQPPFLAGPVPVDLTAIMYESGRGDIEVQANLTEATMQLTGLNWEKKAFVGGHASAQLRLTDGLLSDMPHFSLGSSNGLDVSGQGSFEKGQLRKIFLDKVKFARTDVQATVTLRQGEGPAFDLSGNSFDAREIVSGDPSDHQTDKKVTTPKQHREQPLREDQLPLAIQAKFAQVWVSDEGVLRNVSAAMTRDRRDWRRIRIDGTVGGGQPLHVEIQPAGANRRSLKMTSGDAGAVFKNFDIFDNMLGGQLLVEGSYDDADPRQPLKGVLTVSDFQLVKAPALARLLTVAALTGIVDLLQGSGIPFSTLDLPFTLTDGVLALHDARAAGTALGLTVKGQVDLDADMMALEGTVVPIYALNSALGNIPVLGSLFSGEKGGGVFAMNYSMNGPSKDPTVVVNPLSALTPGMLRKLFDIFDNGSETEVRPKDK